MAQVMPDNVSREVGRVVAAVINEVHNAAEKHGYENTPMSPTMDNGMRLIILVEEVGEVARAMTYDNGDPDELDKELIQVAAMAVACVIGLRGSRNGG